MIVSVLWKISIVEPNSTIPFAEGNQTMVWSPEAWPIRARLHVEVARWSNPATQTILEVTKAWPGRSLPFKKHCVFDFKKNHSELVTSSSSVAEARVSCSSNTTDNLLHRHGIFDFVLVSDTYRTTEPVRFAGLWCPRCISFFLLFFLLRHSADAAPTRLRHVRHFRRGSDAAPTRQKFSVLLLVSMW